MGKIVLGCMLCVILLSPAQAFTMSPRVIGGVDATASSHPFMATIWGVENNGKFGQLCGGVLVAPGWVVTAAHCVFDEATGDAFKAASFEVYLGQQQLLEPCDATLDGACSPQQAAKMRRVDGIYVHPAYQNDASSNAHNIVGDIALLHLTKESGTPAAVVATLSLATMTQLQRLQRQHQAGGHDNLRVLGWGKTTNTPGNLAQDLQVADLDYEPSDICGAVYGTSIAGSQICAIDPKGVRDTCNGDSGGPLMVQQNGQVYLLGLTSFGSETCAQKGVPSVYTSIPYYLDWIEQHINAVPGTKVLLLKAVVSPEKIITTRAGAAAIHLQVRNISHSQTAHNVGFRLFASAPIKVVNGGDFLCSAGSNTAPVSCRSRHTLAAGAALNSMVSIESASLPSVDRRLDVRIEPFADEFNLYRNKAALAAVYFEDNAHFDLRVQVASANAYQGVAHGQLLIANRSGRQISALNTSVQPDFSMTLSYRGAGCMPLCSGGVLALGATRAFSFAGSTQAGTAGNPAALVVSVYAADARTATELEGYFLPARLMQVAAPAPIPNTSSNTASRAPQHGSSGGGIGGWALALLLLLGLVRRG